MDEQFELKPCPFCGSNDVGVAETARLIDADALYNRLECRYKNSYGSVHRAYGIAIDEVCDAPTIAPESLVVHGRWEKFDTSSGIITRVRCSCCAGTEPLVFENRPYCPHCGAKMDL